ncbi:hypothetical protein SAMN05660359_03351 [Geodermatophilus obscurus]|uniref:Uncharacterized protein n=1 Tax=Geodermatophilus obscurus TaxID=1861 RepID=A0A1I5H2H2_9ACTN|nr:hypothetical protein [Geodermatophilus obscurus]SFO42419.1 hypothetical protein SAMN05660359_03351 [Geodermatophilus obscurus]
MSDTASLAELAGVAPDVLVRALGDAWFEVAGPPHERWFVSGEPAQVAVGWDGFGFTLARPEPRWEGHRLVWEFLPDRRFSSDEVLYERATLAEAAEEVARKRRRTFRWCPVCRRVNAREHVHDNTGLCMPCAERHLGVVY